MHEENCSWHQQVFALQSLSAYYHTLLLLVAGVRLVPMGTGTLWRFIDPVIPGWSCCFSEDLRVYLTKAIMSVLYYTAIHRYRTMLLAEENLI